MTASCSGKSRYQAILPILFCLLILGLTTNAQNRAAFFSNYYKYYRCGNISVPGNQLTVEAMIKLETPPSNVVGLIANNIVAKHSGGNDANYILRPDHCEITTTTGHHYTSLALLSTFYRDSFYHVAMTYDGSQLRFFVNGCLYDSKAVTGNLITNNWATTIGQLASNPNASPLEQLYGYTDEVRIWSIVRTQSEIRSNMHDLPNPTGQTGLLAYYKFESNSINVQGNSTFDALPSGSPSIIVQEGFARVQPFNAVYQVSNPSCGNDGRIVVQPWGGKAPYQYSINGSSFQSSSIFSGLAPGTYNVSVKSDGLGCQKDTTITLTAQCVSTISSCNGLQIRLGTASFDQGYDIAAASNNEYYAVGTTRVNGNDDILIVRFRSDASIVWSRVFGGVSTESVRKVLTSSDDGVLIVGQTRSFGNSQGEMLALKISASGSLVWSKRFGVGSSNGDLAMDIIETTDGGYAISGIFNVAGGIADVAVIRLDNAQNIVWSRRLARADGEDGVGLVQKGDTIVVAADLQNGAGNYSFAVTKMLLNNGSVVFSRELIPSSRGLFNPYLFRNPSGPGYIVSGHVIDGISYANMKHGVIQLDESLNVVRSWTVEMPVNANDFFTGLMPLSDGSFVGCSSPQSGTEGYIYKFSSTGTPLFAKKFSGPTNRRLNRLVVKGLDVLAIGAITNGGQQDIFVAGMKVDGVVPGNCTVADVAFSTSSISYSSVNFSWPSSASVTVSQANVSMTSSSPTVSSFDVCPKPVIDFGYQQDACNPRAVQFTSALPGAQGFQWNFGNNTTNSSSLTPSVIYQSYGTYVVRLDVQFPGGCADSVIKSIDVNRIFDGGLVMNSDTSICLGDSLQLLSTPALAGYCWSTPAGSIALGVNGWIRPTSPTMYVLSGQVKGSNLIQNPSFSGGNANFISDYTYSSFNNTEGQYWVGATPATWNGAVANCGDHTTGTGNMMVVNGSPVAGARVWSQTVPVTPNTNYQFSTWISSVSAPNPANLQFSINGANLGNTIIASSATCQWSQFASTWNSGANTSATITIVNNNTVANGNDFALDDLFFGTFRQVYDSVRVGVTGLCDSVKITGPNRICSPSDTLTYSIYKSPNCNENYVFQVDNAFVEIISQTPTSIRLKYLQSGSTTIRIAFANSCKTVVDSIPVQIKFAPTAIDLGPDISICRDTSLLLHAGPGFESYVWQNNSTDSTLLLNSPGLYTVTAQNLCGVTYRDSIRYVKTTAAPFSWGPANARVCGSDSVQFTASGGTSYAWSPAGNFNNPSAPSPKGWVNASQNFSLQIIDAACQRDTLITIPVESLAAADIQVFKSNDVNCSVDTAVLTAQGGISYTWQPNQFISRQTSNSVTVRPPQSLTYVVTGRDALGCIGVDSVTVNFDASGEQKLFTPTAFTPNGDGLNDLFLPAFIGPSKEYRFQVYNRWGQLVFETNTPGRGWDGRFKGQSAPNGVYVFYVTAEGGCNGQFKQKGTVALIR